MKDLLLYLITFIISYLFYFIFVLSRKNILKKFPEGKEMQYLKYRYKVKITDKNLKKIANKVCLANSFILSTTVYVVCLFDKLIIEISVGLITLLVLVLVIYHLIGTYYGERGGK